AILKLANQLHLLGYRAKPPTLVRPLKRLVTERHPATRPIPDLHPMLIRLPGTFLDRIEFHLSEHRDHRRDSPPHRRRQIEMTLGSQHQIDRMLLRPPDQIGQVDHRPAQTLQPPEYDCVLFLVPLEPRGESFTLGRRVFPRRYVEVLG